MVSVGAVILGTHLLAWPQLLPLQISFSLQVWHWSLPSSRRRSPADYGAFTLGPLKVSGGVFQTRYIFPINCPPHNFCKSLRIKTSGFSWIVLILQLTSVKTWAVLVSMQWKNRYCQEDFSVEVMEKVGFPSDGTSRSHMAYTLPGPFPSGFHTLNHLILTTVCVWGRCWYNSILRMKDSSWTAHWDKTMRSENRRPPLACST